MTVRATSPMLHAKAHKQHKLWHSTALFSQAQRSTTSMIQRGIRVCEMHNRKTKKRERRKVVQWLVFGAFWSIIQ